MPEMGLLGIKPRSSVGKTRANEQLCGNLNLVPTSGEW
eukprot:CAMPEP_0194682824 /NCGR_PEP_ID=MMETSP0295-20121207/13020_1 /TAXON_ID=39354 /ORGANISM="Heterosigma akashiwo, Strain CCMP2393" /LENGTH=37 /DNA_ID= /DNA_START= /DNA_END= /DNA_ORIENTATION=